MTTATTIRGASASPRHGSPAPANETERRDLDRAEYPELPDPLDVLSLAGDIPGLIRPDVATATR